MMKVVVCVSGGGTNLQSLIEAKAKGALKEAELVQVIASRPGIYALERAAKAGIPSCVVRRKDYPDLASYDRAMMAVLAEVCGPENDDVLIVLAGFLTRLGPDFVQRYRGKIMNIHPSLLPSFGGEGFYGIKPHEAVLQYGCKVTGATVHLVDEVYDHGPIVAQRAVEVKDDDVAEVLQKRVMDEAESVLLPYCVDLFTQGKIVIKGQKTFIKQ